MQNAVVFGDGKCSARTKLYKSAELLGKILAEKGYNIVNGGYKGVMEATAKGASQFDVERIGVVVRAYKSKPNKYITKIIEVDNYLQRLQRLIELGTIYFVFEGGSGTLLEFAALLALKERDLLEGNIFCIGKDWQKVQKFLCRQMKNFKNISFKGFHFLEKIEDIGQTIIT